MNLKLPYNLLKDLTIFTVTASLRLATYPYLLQKASYRINQRGVIKLTKQAITTYLIIFFAFSSVAGLFLFNPFGADEADAAWFNDNWAYRKAITATVATNASDRTNVDLYLTIDTTGITANLQTSCEDLRFTDTSGNILPYYIQSCNDNSATNKLFVRATLIPKNSTTFTMYMYYGNPGAIAGSNANAFNLYVNMNGYWSFEETSAWATNCSTQSILDSSGNGNTFAPCPNASAATQSSSGKFGSAANFDGTNDYLGTVSDDADLDLGTGDLTISAWVKFDTVTNEAGIMSKKTSSNDAANVGWNFMHWSSGNGGNFCLYISDGSTQEEACSGSYTTTGTWYHVVGIFNRNDSAGSGIWVNGVRDVSASFTFTSPSPLGTVNDPNQATIGSHGSAASHYTDGLIDDVRMYKRAFSQSEISQLYSNTTGNIAVTNSFASEEKGPSPVSYWKFDDGWGVLLKNSGQAVQDTQSGLIGYWKLDENTGTTITDSSGLGKTGTFGAAAAAPTWTSSGKYDAGVSFDGGDNIAISSPGLPTTDFTYSTWVNLSNVAGGVFLQAEDDSGSDTDEMHLQITNTNLQVRMDGATVISATIAISTATWYHIVVTRSGSTVTAYLDNAVAGSGTSAATLAFSDCELILGSDSTSACPTTVFASGFQGSLDEVRVYNRPLTTAQITAIYNQGPEPTTVNSPTWQTENLCISAKCLYFDGTNNEYTVKYDEAALDFAAADNFTLGAWVKRNGTASANTVILQKSTANIGSTYTGYKMYMDASGDLCFAIQDGTNAVDSACTSAVDFDDDEWHFIEGVKAATTSVTLYVDGIQRAQDASIASTGTLVNSSSLRVGIDNDGTSNDWLGFIDEVKVYRDNTARTAAQVTADYNARSNPEGVSQQQGNNNQNMPPALSNGLVGYWKMDETSWTNDCSTTSVTDSSGSGKNGISCPNGTGPSTTPASKYGYSGSFDGSNDYVEVASATDLPADHTMSAWIYPTTSFTDYGTIFDSQSSGGTQNDQYNLYLKANAEFSTYLNGECTTGGSYTLSLNSWQHISATYNHTLGQVKLYLNGQLANTCSLTKTGSGTTVLRMGARSSSTYPYNGRLDEARIYNRALSPAEISQLYSWNAGPSAYWRLDEGSGSTAYDSSGNGNNSTSIDGSPSWTSGKYGKTINFDGTNDAVNINESTTIDFGKAGQSYTVMAWAKNSTTDTSNQPILTKNASSDAPGVFALQMDWTTNQAQFMMTNSAWTIDSSVNGTTNIRDGKWHHIAGIRNEDTNQVYIYVDGKLEGTAADDLADTDISSDRQVIIGSTSNGGSFWPGPIDEVKLYNYARTAGQIVEDMNASHPAPGSPVGTPVGFWKFNEGVDDTCSGGTNDACNSGSGSNTYDGTSTATRTNSGKLSRALDFDGTDDVVTITNGDGIDMNTNLANFTFSSWVYPDTDGEADTGQIFNKGANTYFRTDSQGTTDLDLECNLDRATTDTNVNVTDGLTTGTWAHVGCAWDGTTLSVFINGKLRGSSTSGSGAISADANDLLIGGGTSNNFDGKIDEFKVYNSALTASQMALDSNSASAQVLGATGDNTTAGAVSAESQEYCIPGDSTTCTVPVGRWDFEKQSSNNQTHYDTSGNANNCTDFNGTALAIGKIGKATDVVDSVGGSMSCGSGSTLDNLPASGMTIEGWIYPDSMGEFNQGMIARKNGYYVNGWWFNFNSSGTNSLAFNSDHATTDLARTTANNTVTLNAWNHVALTWTGSTTATTVKIYINGSETTYNTTTDGVGARASDAAEDWAFGDDGGGTASFDGKIDQFRAFNYVRTPAQIAYDYNRGAPIAHWKMDECQGTTINNSSGSSSFAGTIVTAGTVGTCTSSGQWFSGVTGKRNYSFDYANDNTRAYAPLGSSIPTGDFTYSAWVKPTTTNVFDTIFAAESTTTGDTDELMIFLSDTPHKLTVRLNGSDAVTGAKTIADGEWILVTVTRIGSTVTEYLNGASDGTGTDGTALTFNSACNLSIGADQTGGCDEAGGTWDGWFDGLIDDARVYNYGLTATQVKSLYNDGAARYGPVTGAP